MEWNFRRTLTVTKEEQKFISDFLTTMEKGLGFTLEEPEDLVGVMCAISAKNPRAWFLDDRGSLDIYYQD